MRFKKTSLETAFFVKIYKNSQKSAAMEGFFFHRRILQTKNILNYFADENFLRDQNLRGHFEETVIYHIEKNVGCCRLYRKVSHKLFQKDSFLLNFTGIKAFYP